MRFMVFMIPNQKAYEAGAMPTEEAIEAMTKFNTDLVNAGVMITGDGLHPPANSVRATFIGGKTKIIDGPFSESKEVIGGFWIWETKTREEAIEWLKRIPPVDHEQVVELRQVFGIEDFPPSEAVDRAFAVPDKI